MPDLPQQMLSQNPRMQKRSHFSLLTWRQHGSIYRQYLWLYSSSLRSKWQLMSLHFTSEEVNHGSNFCSTAYCYRFKAHHGCTSYSWEAVEVNGNINMNIKGGFVFLLHKIHVIRSHQLFTVRISYSMGPLLRSLWDVVVPNRNCKTKKCSSIFLPPEIPK